MDAKLLTENGWKTIVQRSRVRDNGLQRALATYEKLDENEFEERLEALANVSKMATNLKKVREVAANKEVTDYLADVIKSIDAAKKVISGQEVKGRGAAGTGLSGQQLTVLRNAGFAVAISKSSSSSCSDEWFDIAEDVVAILGLGVASAELAGAPEPTTITKWAALATAAALCMALVKLARDLDKLIKCKRGAGEDVQELERRQRQLEQAVERLRREMAQLHH